jgi:hypothetical protein
MQRFSRLSSRAVTVVALLVAALSAGTHAPGGPSGLTSVAYQSAAVTVTTISNMPTAPYGTCVPVAISVGSDAGTPQGTIAFAIDGVVVDRQAVPSNGVLVEMVGCCNSRLGAALAVGTHQFTATFVPSGNWAASEATGQVVIQKSSGAAPACGGVSSVGLPHGVNAGLASLGDPDALSSDELLRAAVTGLALGAAITVVIGYRRRESGR